MHRDQILQMIRDRGLKSVKFPDKVGFSVKNKLLTIEVPLCGVIKNMQHDESAFEGWALCVKSYLNDIIDNVDIIWNVDSALAKNCHYKRFLYRVWNFISIYEWAKCSCHTFAGKSTNGWIANIPAGSAKETAAHKEAALEREYINHHSGESDVMGQQLPVGLFNGKVCRQNRETPGSYLDIWAIKDDTLHIFELKDARNKKIGIISELMFYVNVMNDIMKHRIRYANGADKVDYRGFDSLFKAYQNQSINRVIGHFLADAIHTFITPQVIQLMNDSSALRGERINYQHTLVGID